MKRFTLFPHVAAVRMHEEPSAEALIVAEAVRHALMRYVSMNQLALVEKMDLRTVIVEALRDARHGGSL